MPDHDKNGQFVRQGSAKEKVYWVLFDKSDGSYLMPSAKRMGIYSSWWGERRDEARVFTSLAEARECRKNYNENVRVRRITRGPKAERYVIERGYTSFLCIIKNGDGRYLCEFKVDLGGFSFGWGTKDEAVPLKKDEADAFLEFAKKKSVYAGDLFVEDDR